MRLPEWLTQASCLQSWLQASVGTDMLQVSEKHTNYCQQDKCTLTPSQWGGELWLTACWTYG